MQLNFNFPKVPLWAILLSATVGFSYCYPQNLRAEFMPLSQSEIEQKISIIPEWQQEEQTLTRTFTFKNFVEAIAFIDRLVEPAEAAGHHPDIYISYNKVTISLTTHDAGGLTQMDFDLAETISALTP